MTDTRLQDEYLLDGVRSALSAATDPPCPQAVCRDVYAQRDQLLIDVALLHTRIDWLRAELAQFRDDEKDT